MSWLIITNRELFLALSAGLIFYILYMMIRRRRGLRPGKGNTEPEI
jgi:hypothetical protein